MGEACKFISARTLVVRIRGRNNQKGNSILENFYCYLHAVYVYHKNLKCQEATAIFLGKQGCLAMTLMELLFYIACPCPLSLVRYPTVIKGGGGVGLR